MGQGATFTVQCSALRGDGTEAVNYTRTGLTRGEAVGKAAECARAYAGAAADLRDVLRIEVRSSETAEEGESPGDWRWRKAGSGEG
jgi:hypothetical protein